MNQQLRHKAQEAGLPLVEYVLRQMRTIETHTGRPMTLFAACPNSIDVIRASLRAAKRNRAPIKFAATLNQVDLDKGYTGMDQFDFVRTIKQEARRIHFEGPVMVAVDHGGPWLKDLQKKEQWPYEKAMAWVKRSFEAAVAAGYDLIHVDPTVDIFLPQGETIKIETVAERTVELIAHVEAFRKKGGYPRIAYEVGTEEVHGGLADMTVFTRFFDLLKSGLAKEGLADVWPVFVVGKVGTDLHTTSFDPEVAKQLVSVAARYGSYIKGHYTDNVDRPEAYPLAGMGAANVGPEFTEREYEALMELAQIEKKWFEEQKIASPSNIKQVLWEVVIASNRWQKWLQPDEDANDFYNNAPERQLWLVKTGCRYIWEDPKVKTARTKLYENLESRGLFPREILLSHIEHAMDKYMYRFNLTGLNDDLLKPQESKHEKV